MEDTMEAVSYDGVLGWSGEGYPLGWLPGLEERYEGYPPGDMLGGESLGTESGTEVGSSGDMSGGEFLGE